LKFRQQNIVSHWYDGFFYEKFIAPNQDSLYTTINGLIKPDSTIIDVGCATGRLSYRLANKYKSYIGIDPSIKNILRAKKNIKNKQIEFFNTDIESFVLNTNRKFDYSIMTYVIHEVPENKRISILNSMAKISDTLIIADYTIPRPKTFRSILNEMVEFFAGKNHYRNFKNFEHNGGLKGLIGNSDFEILTETNDLEITSQILILKQK